jgi:hypothetical protein
MHPSLASKTNCNHRFKSCWSPSISWDLGWMHSNLGSLVMTLGAIRYVILIRYEMRLIIIWVKDYDVHGKLWSVRLVLPSK